MESSQAMTGFGVGPDWETFQRVWKRVMPNEENSPVQVRRQPGETVSQKRPESEKPKPENPLEELMRWLCTGVVRSERMAGRPGGPAIWKLLYQQRRQTMRQFGTLYFLHTGKRYSCGEYPSRERWGMDQMLRQEYLWEKRWEELCDPVIRQKEQGELAGLCVQAVQQSRQRREKIRQTLEGLA